MRPTERNGYIPAVARVLFEAFPEWAETATVTEEQSVTVTSGVSVSTPCLRIRIPSPVTPNDANLELLIDIVEDETTVFFGGGHTHLGWWREGSFDDYKADIVGYVRDIIHDVYITIHFLNGDGAWAGASVIHESNQKKLNELPPPGLTKHVRSWTGLYNADITGTRAAAVMRRLPIGANELKKYNWGAVPEDAMPSVTGDILRRFVGGEQMTIARVAFSEGASMAPHKHPNEQFSIVLSGVMEFTIEGVPVRAETGEVVHLASNETHGARAITEAVVLDVFAPPRADWGEPKA